MKELQETPPERLMNHNLVERKFDIYINEPFQSGKELTFLKEALDNNWLSTEGEQIQFFEQQLKNYINVEHLTLTNSGTSALHLALITLGIKEGDFVICQSFSFVASANPILYQKAIPVFVDSEEETWNMDPDFLREAIEYCLRKGKKPRAIIMVHTYGIPAKINKIKSICREYEIPLIEDAAEALGSTYFDQPAGSLGDLSILSFNGNKIITSTSGGALIAQNDEIIRMARLVSNQSKDENNPHNHVRLGFNYKMSNICAAVGRAQMHDLDKRVTRKREIFQLYKTLLSDCKEIQFQGEEERSISNRWVTTLTANRKNFNKIITEKLLKYKIESRYLWKPIHLIPYFKEFSFFGDQTCGRLHDCGVALPSGLGLAQSEQERIAELIYQELK